MTAYVALFRGINVGGARKLPMKELRAMCEALGYEDVRTYIASGNVAFSAGRGEHEATLRAAIHETFGYHDVPVLVRSARELLKIHAANPYDTAGADPRLVHVAFLANKPAAAGVKKLEAFDPGPNELTITPHAVYLRYGESPGRSKLNQGVLERRMGVDVTARNLRTVRKLLEMVS